MDAIKHSKRNTTISSGLGLWHMCTGEWGESNQWMIKKSWEPLTKPSTPNCTLSSQLENRKETSTRIFYLSLLDFLVTLTMKLFDMKHKYFKMSVVCMGTYLTPTLSWHALDAPSLLNSKNPKTCILWLYLV